MQKEQVKEMAWLIVINQPRHLASTHNGYSYITRTNWPGSAARCLW